MADRREWSLGVVGLALLSGGLAGAVVGLLLAPQSGRELRSQLRGYVRRAEKNIHEVADKATQVFDHAADKGRDFIKDKHAFLTEAVEAGRAAIQWEREQLSGEKKA